MRPFAAVSVVAVIAFGGWAPSCGQAAPRMPPTIVGHPVRLDASGKLLSWVSTDDAPYAAVSQLAWRALETKFPVQDNGLETWLAYSRFDPDTFGGVNWPHNPAGLYAMLTDSAVLWYAFSGDRAAIDVVRKALDHQLAHGTTPADWDWARAPFASADPGAIDYGGADDEWCGFCGRGDGPGVIEPDKVGELGFAYMQMFEATGDTRYRDAATACADALVRHVREGDERHSPWPFRVNARTNAPREEYSANVVGALTLFDELARLSIGDVGAYRRTRSGVLEWLMRVPMSNDTWTGYFEDIETQTDPASNPNQYVAIRVARWLMAHPDDDPRWREHVAHLIGWVARVFGADTAAESGSQWGATVVSEQVADMAKMGSHTARFGAALALWSQTTGDTVAREKAARSLNWATYVCGENGVVAVGEDRNEGWWFSDGYGDYIRHFMTAMAAVPDWAPPHQNHLLYSTSVVSEIRYEPARIAWTTFDRDATETLRLAALPAEVSIDGTALGQRADLSRAGFAVTALPDGDVLVRVRHASPGEVVVRLKR